MKAALRLLCLLFVLLLTACAGDQSQNWQLSPTFDVVVKRDDGSQITLTMRGQEGHLGFIDSPFVAGKGNKYMWHLWAPAEQFTITSQLKVTAVSKESKERLVILETGLGGANNGATAHTPSLMSLPSPGLWRLEVSVDDKPFGEIVVEAVPAP